MWLRWNENFGTSVCRIEGALTPDGVEKLAENLVDDCGGEFSVENIQDQQRLLWCYEGLKWLFTACVQGWDIKLQFLHIIHYKSFYVIIMHMIMTILLEKRWNNFEELSCCMLRKAILLNALIKCRKQIQYRKWKSI